MRVLVATIGKPFGIRGNVTMRLRTDEPELRLAVGNVLFTEDAGGKSYTVESLRLESPGGVIGFSGVTDRNQAEALRGEELWAKVDHGRTPVEADEWYDHQLIGLPCRAPGGQHLGEVVAVEHHPAHDSLLVRTGNGDRYVPFVSAIVPEVSADAIVIDDPGGLLSDADSGTA